MSQQHPWPRSSPGALAVEAVVVLLVVVFVLLTT